MNLPPISANLSDVSRNYREERDFAHIVEKSQKKAYKSELDKQVLEHAMKKQQERQQEIDRELAMLTNYPPFGRRQHVNAYSPDFARNIDSRNNNTNNNNNLNNNNNNNTYETSYTNFNNNQNNNLQSIASFNDINNKTNNERNFQFDDRELKTSESKLSRHTTSDKYNSFYTNSMPQNLTSTVEPRATSKTPLEKTKEYFPWGKSGGGAPIVDKAGQKNTKIAGNLWFNINGQTPNDRVQRLEQYKVQNNSKIVSRNILESATTRDKNASPQYREPENDPSWLLEKKLAYVKQLENNIQATPRFGLRNTSFNTPESQYDLHRGNSNWLLTNFGRPGNGAPLYDTRRRNLFEQLESPRTGSVDVSKTYSASLNISMPTMLFSKVNPVVLSSHRNGYDYIPKKK